MSKDIKAGSRYPSPHEDSLFDAHLEAKFRRRERVEGGKGKKRSHKRGQRGGKPWLGGAEEYR
jgi:hypothetical protein